MVFLELRRDSRVPTGNSGCKKQVDFNFMAAVLDSLNILDSLAPQIIVTIVLKLRNLDLC